MSCFEKLKRENGSKNLVSVGVVPKKKVRDIWSRKTGTSSSNIRGLSNVEKNHSHIILSNCEDWGQETQTMFSIADSLSKEAKVVCLVANGGKHSLKEVRFALDRKFRLVCVHGTLLLADQLAQLKLFGSISDEKEVFVPKEDFLFFSRHESLYVFPLFSSEIPIEKFVEKLLVQN